MLPRPARLTGGSWAFFLDVDGTVLDIADAPDLVHVDARLTSLLDSLRRESGGAFAMVSGRPIADLDRLFAPLRLPLAGLHGAERRDARGRVHRLRPAGDLAKVVADLRNWSDGQPGTLVEDKGGAVALHFRLAREAEPAAREAVTAALAGLGPDYALQAGKCVLEIKPSAGSKARAITEFMSEPPFAGRRPVFVGDDVTDEDGFRAVRRLGGIAVAVGDRPETQAEFALADVAAVRDWLAEWVAAEKGAML